MKSSLNFNLLKRTTVITLGLVLDKIFLFVLPYILNAEKYSQFNKDYYLAGLIALFGLLGFNFSIKTFRLKNSIIFLLVLINTLIVSLIIRLFFEKGAFPVLPIIFAVTSILFSIYQFEFLFNNELGKYFYTIILIIISGISALLTAHFANLDVFTFYVIFSIIALLGISRLIPKGHLSGKKEIAGFYTAGIAAFIINSAAVAVLSFGKYIASSNYTIETSNTFIFASLLVTPLYFSGNIIERVIYTIKREIANKTLFLILALLAGYSLYGIALIVLTQLFPSLLPRSIDGKILLDILIIMLVGTTIFGAIHFPLNGVLFKELEVIVQEKLALFYLLVSVLFSFIGYMFFDVIITNFVSLLIFTYLFLLTLAGVKFILIWRYRGKGFLLRC